MTLWLKRSLIIPMVTLLTACASTPQSVDNTPTNPTAVVKADYVINGRLVPDAQGTKSTYTRSNQQRVKNQKEHSSWMSKKLFSSFDHDTIIRLDKNLMWQLYNKQERYKECPLDGCKVNLFAGDAEGEDGEWRGSEETEKQAPRCETTMVENKFSVVETGEKRVINGFDSRKYTVTWRVEEHDAAKRANVWMFKVDTWTTVPTDDMREVWAVKREFEDAYLRALNRDDTAFTKVLPLQVYLAFLLAMDDFLEQHSIFDQINTEFAKIQGHPVSVTAQFDVKNNACPAPKEVEKKEEIDFTDPQKALAQVTGSFFKKKAEEKAEQAVLGDKNDPIFRYVYELKSISINDEKDSVFQVPANYELVTRD